MDGQTSWKIVVSTAVNSKHKPSNFDVWILWCHVIEALLLST